MSNMKRDNITGKEITYYGEQPAAAGASYEQGLRYAGPAFEKNAPPH